MLRCYLPYDMPGAVRRFLRAWRPTLGLVMETEVWPTLIDECRRADIRALVNTSGTSARRANRSSAIACCAATCRTTCRARCGASCVHGGRRSAS
ncbi:glycosyltransferase N-terminal domain-containing protein [Burkholderia cenocepacia]|nr:glycosyltransferase N-terminal domain-containing protein [Burkholderia cenocepacia]